MTKNNGSSNVYKLTLADRVILINPDEEFHNPEEAKVFALTCAQSDCNHENRYLVVEGTLLAGFAACGTLEELEPSEEEENPDPDYWTAPDAA
jgi:hypothetical protein